jgi:hypothetical protein
MTIGIVPWFRSDRLPALIADRAIVVGGTPLLGEFLSLVAASADGGALAVAAPFIGRTIAHQMPAWRAMRHASIDFTLVTQSTADARASVDEIGDLPWRSFAVWVSPRLHAKVYAFVGAGGDGACLVGSHNLTAGGTDSNHEAGTLFVTARFSEMHDLITACQEHVTALGRLGTRYMDTLAWPECTTTVSRGERT